MNMTLRLPDEAWVDVLRVQAARDRRSFHGHILWLLREAAEEREREEAADASPILRRNAIPEGAGGTMVIPKLTTLTSSCTCGPGERAKGKHNKYCPMRGK